MVISTRFDSDHSSVIISRDSERESLLDKNQLIGEELANSSNRLEQQSTPYLYFVIVVIVLCPLQFGWNIGVINTPETIFTQCSEPYDIGLLHLPSCFLVSKTVWGMIAAGFPIGGLFAGVVGGALARRIGRKNSIFYNNLIFMGAGLVMALSPNVPVLFIGRFMVGFGAGIGSTVSPMYFAEIPPIRLRGSIGAINQLAIVTGLLLSQAFTYFFTSEIGWRFLFGAPIIPAVLQMLLLPFCVESPRFLILKGRINEARTALRRLRGQLDIETELSQLIESHERDVAVNSRAFTFSDLTKTKSLRNALLLSVIIHMAQQFSGINGVIQFSTSIFQRATSSEDQAALLTFVSGIVNLIVTLISVGLMDRAGRRLLLLTSQFAMVFLSILFAIFMYYDQAVLGTICIMVFIATFAIGLGPIPWLIMPEVFPTYAIAKAAAVGVTINWLCNVLITFGYPPVSAAMGFAVFYIFAGLTFVLAMLTYWFLPETKGKSLEEISHLLAQ